MTTAPTRGNLLRLRRQLAQVQRGGALLRRKRHALVRELFRLAAPAVDLREQIRVEFNEAYRLLLAALGAHGRAGLRAIAGPPRDIGVVLETGSVWGVPVAEVVRHDAIRRAVDARAASPGSAGPSTTDAAARFEGLTERLVDAATREQRLRRLAEAVAESTRQMRMVEQRLTPRLEAAIGSVRQALDEREREEHLRLKHAQRRRTSAPNRAA